MHSVLICLYLAFFIITFFFVLPLFVLFLGYGRSHQAHVRDGRKIITLIMFLLIDLFEQ